MKEKSRYRRMIVAMVVAIALLVPAFQAAGAEGTANADLAGITLNHGTLDPAFDPSVTAYAVVIEPQYQGIIVTPMLSDPAATFKVNDEVTASKWFNVNPGQSVTATIIVTASDLATTKTYSVNITRTAPQNGRLAGINVSAGGLTPDFLPNTRRYKLTLDENTPTVTITPEKGYATDILRIDGRKTDSKTITLRNGQTRIVTITVRPAAAPRIVTTYTLRVFREKSSDARLQNIRTNPYAVLASAFSPDVTAYTLTIPYNKPNVLIRPVPFQKDAVIKINGSRTVGRYFTLIKGVPREVRITVISPNRKVTQNYTITLVRILPPT
jgi:hypothetical protein